MPDYTYSDGSTTWYYTTWDTTSATVFDASPWTWQTSGTAVTNGFANLGNAIQQCSDAMNQFANQNIVTIPVDPQPLHSREDEGRSEELLLESLNEAQRVMYKQAKKFLVRGGETGDIYEINQGRARNIRVLDEQGNRKRTLCAHPVDNVPNFDTMLAQKLMLENCEREFLRVANVS